MSDLRVLDWLLSQKLPLVEMPTFSDWKPVYDHHSQGWMLPVERAIVGGYVGDRLAYAFIGGYQAALQRMVPTLPDDQIAALCITEEGGGHPRAIKTTLSNHQVSGVKAYISCAGEASILLIAASIGVDDNGLNRLKIAKVRANAPGVTIEPLSNLDMVPEVSHGRALLDCVTPEEVFPEDGYSHYIKPFRTIEDLHVFAACIAYLLRLANDMPSAVKESLISYLAAIIPLTQQDPDAPFVRIAVSGIMRELNALLSQFMWSQVDATVFDRWERDKLLLHVADRVRAQQLENARKHYGL